MSDKNYIFDRVSIFWCVLGFFILAALKLDLIYLSWWVVNAPLNFAIATLLWNTIEVYVFGENQMEKNNV